MADRYFRNTGNTNWGTASNWSTTDGGGADAAVPLAADNVFLTALSGNCTVNASTRDCHSLNCTGYTGTLNMSAQIQLNGVGGGVVLSPNMTITGGQPISSLQNGGTSTWTANGKTWPNSIILNGSSGPTFSFTDTWTTNTLTLGGGSKTLGGAGQITINGSLLVNATTGGGCLLILGGTGNWTSDGSFLGNNLTINTAGTITIPGTVYFQTRTLTYLAGTVNASSSTLSLEDDCTLNTNGINWNNIIVNAAMTVTNNSLCTINGTLTHTNGNRTWAGTAGFIANSWIISSTGASIHSLKASVTYTVTNLIRAILSSPAAHPIIKSGTGGTKANFILSAGCVCTLGYVDFTDIDANAGGRPIQTFNGTLSNTTNVFSYKDPYQTQAKSFVG